MSNIKNILVILFILLYATNIIINTVYAQENNTTEISKENEMIHPQNASFSETTQKSEVTKEDILMEAQRSIDRSLSILNIVATLMGVLVTILAVVVAIVGGLGFLEIKKWNEHRKNIEEYANVISEYKNKGEQLEQQIDKLREGLDKNSQPYLSEKPSKEVLDKLDEFSSKLELFEILGASLKPEDYINHGKDLYYKEKYELALKAVEKAIELKPDYALAWNNKFVVLFKLNRIDEAFKANDKAIMLEPNKPGPWYKRACAYSLKKDKENALSYLKKAIGLDKSYKKIAKKDKDFENLWNDVDFKKLVD